ncbi:MAG: hypothetical protein NC311_02165 [Muribaculaceae bacterium]|nr:hypothetical protein [Muribaculaceae bacterium]
MYRILRVLALFSAVVFTSNAFAAGYTCDSIKQYTSCSLGYYMTYNGSYNGTSKVGNACTACPSGCTCAGDTAAPVCGESCAARTYWNGSSCEICTGGNYCPGFSNVQNPPTNYGLNACPDATTNKRANGLSAAPFYNAKFRSAGIESRTGLKAETECTSLAWYNAGDRAGLYEYVKYNSSTKKYENTESWNYMSAAPGWYLTTKTGCGAYAYYSEVKQCEAGYYCPGKSEVACNSSNQSTVHTTTFGRNSCAAGYHSSAGASSCTANTYTVKYNLNNGGGTVPGDTTCTYGSACTLASLSATTYYRGGYKIVGWSTSSSATSGMTSTTGLTTTNGGTVTVYAVWSACGCGKYHPAATGTAANSCKNVDTGYYTTSTTATGQSVIPNGKFVESGSCTAESCSDYYNGNYPDSRGNKSSDAWCCVTVSAGKYIAEEGGAQLTCPAGSYCPGGMVIDSDGTGLMEETDNDTIFSCSEETGGKYTSSTAGASSIGQCYLTLSAGYRVASAGAGKSACPAGRYCTSTSKIYYNTTGGTATYSYTGSCPAGTYSTGGATSSACTSALSGYTAAVCGTNTWSAVGASSCTACDTGYSNSGTAAASHALRSSCYITVTGGHYIGTAGQTSSNWGTCTAGTYKAQHNVNYGSTSSCSACSGRTQYSGAGASSCSTVSSGYYTTGCNSSNNNCTGQSQCGSGTWCASGVQNQCSSLSGASPSGGSYTSVSPRNANTTCRYTAPSKTITGCASVTSNTMSYSGTAWPASTYAVSASGGYIIANNNTASATCTQCSGRTWSAGGTATSCTACLAAEEGWTAAGGGTGQSSYTTCKETKTGTAISSNCSAGVLTKTQSSASAWGTTSVTTALQAKAGSYVNGQTCSQCAAGSYTSAVNTQTSCTSAGKGYYVSGTGATSQSACAIGQYQDATGQSSCKSCPTLTSGYAYAGSTAKQAVTACTETKAAADVSGYCYGGLLTKTAKDASTWNAATSTLTAKAGSHLSGSGDNTTCAQCTGATFQTTNGSSATSCTACVAAESTWTAGTGTGWTAATSCYETKAATSVSSNCSAGQLKKNATSDNKWPTAASISVAFQAKAGSIVSGQSCTQCSGRTWSAGGTATSCTACLAAEEGWTAAGGGTGQSSYTTCKETKTGTAISSNCSAGVLTKTQSSASAWGTTSVTTALQAKAGSYVNGQTCSQCAAGSYTSAVNTQTSCTSAGKGYYVSGTGATSQSACAIGQYQDATGQSSCKSCPTLTSGYAYAGSTAKQAVTACVETRAATDISSLCKSGTLQKTAKDTTTWNTATESVTVNANPGSYVTGSGDSRTCSTCAKNSYCTGDTAAPVACSAISGTGGLYNLTTGTGSSAATQCYASVAAGKYIAKLTDTAVSTCPNWTYKAAHNVYYASNAGTSSCTACPAVETNWSKKDSAGTGWSSNTSCVEVRNATNVSSYCSAGQLQKVATTSPAWPTDAAISVAFQAKAGSFVSGQTCEQCAAGSYTSAAGTQTSCTKCETGKYNNAKGQTSCSTCVNGTTNTGTGNTACSASCTAIDGLSTWSSSALCTVDKCAAGRYKSGNTCPTCSSATSNNYTQSAIGTTSSDSCYLTTDAGKYVKTATKGQETCVAGNYCVGGVTIYYGTGTTTGGSATCASGTSSKYTQSAAGASKVGQCYLTLKAGQQVASAGAGVTSCTAGRYCNSTANIYYNTDGGTAANTGTACSALGGGLYTNSAAGSDANTDCYIAANTISGKYLTANTATALTTCEAGYQCPATAVYWPNVGNRAACTGATYAASTGQASCTACPTATNATDVKSYGYWNTGKDGDHTVREGCNATFNAKSVPNGSMTAYHCYIDKDANSYGIAASGKICWVNTSELKCNAGYYNAAANGGATQPSASTLENLWNNACVQVGAGYWSAANVLTRTACASGLTTIGYGAGADEAADCGRILNVGADKVYLRSVKKTTPSLNVKVGDTTYYGNMTSGALDGYLIIKDGNVTYRVHDDSK